ncbi:hypothetical protein JCM6882_001120 [Rhodosporidiobolus microsporus]
MPCCSQCWSTWAQNLLTDYAWPLVLALVAWVVTVARRATRAGGPAKVGETDLNGQRFAPEPALSTPPTYPGE